MKKSQNGFVLISVLLITTISTIYAFSEIKGNQLQERIGGNQQKEINARMLAEQGIFKSYEYIQSENALSTAHSTIATNLSGISTIPSGVIISEVSQAAGTFSFVSKGTYQGAYAYMKASITAVPAVKKSAYEKAIIGCDGVTVKASGVVNSFDSKKGAYGQPYNDENGFPVVDGNGVPKLNIGALGDVGTISKTPGKGNVVLSGNSPINGNVSAVGTVGVSGSSIVNGNVEAIGNVNLGSRESVEGNLINGNIHSGGNIDANTNDISGSVQAVGTVTDTINVGGSAQHKATNGALGSVNGHILSGLNGSIETPDIAKKSCDTREIGLLKDTYVEMGTTFKKTSGTAINTASGAFTVSDQGGSPIAFNFTPTTGSGKDVDGDTISSQSVVQTVPGKDLKVPVHVFDSVDLSKHTIHISGGEVVFVVNGDFSLKNASQITVAKGSSLKIILTGVFKAEDLTEIKEVANGTVASVAGISALEIISYNTTANSDGGISGVDIRGKDIDATVYAPFAGVRVAASGTYQGAAHGGEVVVDGAARFSFDEDLLKGDGGNGSLPAKSTFQGAYYYYPN